MWLSELREGMRIIFRGTDGKDYTGRLLKWSDRHAHVIIDKGDYQGMKLNTSIQELRPADELTGLSPVEVLESLERS